MSKYSIEQKQEAISLMEKMGVKKTGEELGISIQTLYKWRNEQKDRATGDAQPYADPDDVNQWDDENALLETMSHDALEAKVRQLEEEVEALRQVNARLKKALSALIG